MQFVNDPAPSYAPGFWYVGGALSGDDINLCTTLGHGTAFIRNNATSDGIEINTTGSTWVAVAPESIVYVSSYGAYAKSYAAYAVQFHYGSLTQ